MNKNNPIFDALFGEQGKSGGGGGPSVTVESLSVTENGVYTAPSGKAYSPVSVECPVPPELDTLEVAENGVYEAPDGYAYNAVVVDTPVPPTLDTLSVTQNGAYTPQSGHAYNQVNVNCPSPEPEWKEVTFIDYDGTILHSYTAQEFLAMTAMPANPTPPKTFLTAQGWNWTLADAKAYVQTYGRLVIGQLYITTPFVGETENDSETIFHINITAELPAYRTVYVTGLYNSNAGGDISILWGDGTGDFMNSSGNSHTYAANGEYDISIQVPEGSSIKVKRPFVADSQNDFVTEIYIGDHVVSIGNMQSMRHLRGVTVPANAVFDYSSTWSMFGCSQLTGFVLPARSANGGIPSQAFYNCYALRFISLGLYWRHNTSAFFGCSDLREICFTSTYPGSAAGKMYDSVLSGCSSLEYAVIPNDYTEIQPSVFSKCAELKRVYGMGGISGSIGKAAFDGCASLQHIDIPSGITTLVQNAFQNTSDLETMTLPATVTSIGSNALASKGVLEFHLLGTTPPTLTSSSSISGNTQLSDNDWKIYVPASAVSTYQTASNWSTHSSRILAEPTT